MPIQNIHHVELLKELTVESGPIGTSAFTATDRRHRVGCKWSEERQALDDQILGEFFAENIEVRRDRKAVVMAGPPGAGKSVARKQKIPEGEEKYWRVIDPDIFKERLLRHMVASGEYDEMIPDEVRRHIAQGERFAPGEMAPLVHNESSKLARDAAKIAMERGENFVWDGVNGLDEDGSAGKLVGKMNQLKEAGYTHIDMICVDGPLDVTRARVEKRYLDKYKSFAQGVEDAGYLARWVPQHISEKLYRDGEQRFSCCSTAVAVATEQAPQGVTVHTEVHYLLDKDSAGEPWRTLHKDERGFTTTQNPQTQRIVAQVNLEAQGRVEAGVTVESGSGADEQTRARGEAEQGGIGDEAVAMRRRLATSQAKLTTQALKANRGEAPKARETRGPRGAQIQRPDQGR